MREVSVKPLVNLEPTWEIAFNHFHTRLGVALPIMAKVIPTSRPTGAHQNHMVWETRTHGDVGAVGLPLLLGCAQSHEIPLYGFRAPPFCY